MNSGAFWFVWTFANGPKLSLANVKLRQAWLDLRDEQEITSKKFETLASP